MFKFAKKAVAFLLMATLVMTNTLTGSAADMTNGWYKLQLGDNYLNIDVNGNAELRQNGSNQTFYLENKGKNKDGNNQVTLKTEDGRYLGLDGELKDGVQLKVVKSPYTWNISFATGGLRPPSKPDLVVNASGEKYTDGTKIILWTSKSSTPNHARFSYVPKDAIDVPSAQNMENGSTSSGWPFVPSEQNMTNGVVNSGWVFIVATDDYKLRVNTDNTVSASKRYNNPFYVEHLGDNKYYIHAAYGGYLAPKEKGAKTSTPIVISQAPYKWNLERFNAGGVRKFAIWSNESRNHALQLVNMGLREDEYTLRLSDTVNGRISLENEFIVSDWGVGENQIPEWWVAYKEGKAAPTEKVVEPEEKGQDYYGRLAFAEETKRPITTTSINYNLEYPTFNTYFYNWGTVVKEKLLSKNERGTYLHAFADGDYVTITKYSESGESLGYKELKYELPLFGAIFSGKEYNYIAFGQNDSDEKGNNESVRIVKYDKEFNRISSVSLKGNETKAKKIFAYTARFAESGNQLILHTARTRYKSSDGVNHQSNLDLFVNTDAMTASASSLFPGNHVSHSFDTYVQFVGNTPVYLDLGDGSPRSIVLQKGSGSSYSKATMFGISGPSGANYTGVSVGGFEVAKNNYVTAFATIDQSKAKWGKGKSNASANSGMVPSNLGALKQRNIVVSILPRKFNNGASAKNITIAKYIGTSKIASTPQLLKVSNNKFAVMWAEFSATGGNYSEDDYDEEVPQSYVVLYIDENGKALGDVKRYKNVDDFYKEYRADVTKNSAPSSQVIIVATPEKTTYKVGEGFDTKGINAINFANGKQTNINKDITFYTSNVVELTQGRKFTTAGVKVVEIRYKGERVGSYTVKVTK